MGCLYWESWSWDLKLVVLNGCIRARDTLSLVMRRILLRLVCMHESELNAHARGGQFSEPSLHNAGSHSKPVSSFHWVHCPFGVTSNEKHKESNSICVVSWEPSANYKAATFLPHYARRWEAGEIVPALSCLWGNITRYEALDTQSPITH